MLPSNTEPKHLDLLKYKCFKSVNQLPSSTILKSSEGVKNTQMVQEKSFTKASIETSVSQSLNKIQPISADEQPQVFKLIKDSEAIIFFKQSYQQLFHNPTIQIPRVPSVKITLFNDLQPDYQVQFVIAELPNSQPSQETKTFLSISLISPDGEPVRVQKVINQRVLPGNSADPTLEAKKILQKKTWIRVSASMNTAGIHFDDFATIESQQVLRTQLGLKNRGSWQNSQDIFHLVNKHNSVIQQASPFQKLNSFKIQISYEYRKQSKMSRSSQRVALNKFLKVDILQLTVPQGPVLVKDPSLLRKDANLFYLSKEIRILYEFLQGLSISHLPKLQDFKQPHPRQKQYYEWRNLRAAINNSISTVPGYLQYQVYNQQTATWVDFKQPIGILNLLMQVKSYNPKTKGYFEWSKFSWNADKTFQENLKLICDTRMSYVRMQLCPHEGIAPGSKAVLQIWPPFCCSPIHNHSQAYGLIKVLSNQILVQNFDNITFMPQDNVPYQQNNYQEGSYTWLSEYSYGIHRLINITNETTLSLQAYASDKYSTQFFQFVNTQQGEYAQYYPQNDWVNFLKWSQDKNNNQDPLINKFAEYINTVKCFYKVDGDSDHFFFDFAMTMKSQYQVSKTFMNSGKVKIVKFTPFKP